MQEFILLHIGRCPHYALTFFENMFWREKPQVDTRAATRPSMSKDNSVMLAMATPRMIGTREKYTWERRRNALYICEKVQFYNKFSESQCEGVTLIHRQYFYGE